MDPKDIDPAALSPVFTEPVHAPVVCPACGGLFEAPFKVGNKYIPGHVAGGPTCSGKPGQLTGRDRDARVRRANRRG